METEVKIDNVDREEIWKPVLEKWLENFKSEETPISKRITDYTLNCCGINSNNEKNITITADFSVTPVDENNTAWKERNICFLQMSNVDGEYKVDYISEFPKNYEKFLEEFEKYKAQNQTVETVAVQAQNEQQNSAQEIKTMSNTIIVVCSIVFLIVIGVSISKIFKKLKRK